MWEHLGDMELPETRYAWSEGFALAYQVVGGGPVDLIYLEGYASHVDMNWESPAFARFLRGLAGQSRLIVTDRRGYGCSDRFSPPDLPPIETTVDDLLAVMDAVGSERAVILATSVTGYMGAHFAASHPDRTIGLILESPLGTFGRTEETPWGPTDEWWEGFIEMVRADWGSRRWPGAAGRGAVEEEWYPRWQRASCAPGSLIAECRRQRNTDFHRILPSVHVPTLVLADADGDGLSTPENARYVAGKIPGSQLVELCRGNAELPWYEGADLIVAEVGRFLSGIGEHQATFDRLLATVLFTDIVDSTAQAAAIGDRQWRVIRERHDSLVRSQLAQFRGREVKTMGDGFLATFDGPARAVRCAQAIMRGSDTLGVEIRAGLHIGEVELDGDDVTGIAVAIGARVAALAQPSQVLVSQTIKDLTTGSGIVYSDRGEHKLKGVPDRWRLYQAVS
jgi:class 3 adenylate cyclase/pimeloyl-ACP methyl ester carboxylesterase